MLSSEQALELAQQESDTVQAHHKADAKARELVASIKKSNELKIESDALGVELKALGVHFKDVIKQLNKVMDEEQAAARPGMSSFFSVFIGNEASNKGGGARAMVYKQGAARGELIMAMPQIWPLHAPCLALYVIALAHVL
jgi:hypothetical protein